MIEIVRAMDTLARVERAGSRGTARRMLSDTPRRLIFSGLGLSILTVALVAVLAGGFSAASTGLSTMSAGADEVGVTNDLYFRLNDMDAQAANALLVGFRPTIAVPAAVSAQSAVGTYESDRKAADRDLQRIAADPALADPSARLLDALGDYEAAVAETLYIDRNDAAAQLPAQPPATALAQYQSASTLMHNSILPIASAITSADSARVNDQYTGDVWDVHAYALLAAIAALAAVLAALAISRYLARRFRRMLAPTLLVAMAATLAVAGSAVATLLHEATQFTVAKRDAFDSITALTRARAVSYDANADESRWLLDRTAAVQGSFFEKVSQIAAAPGVNAAAAAAQPSDYYDGLKSALARLSADPAADKVTDVKIGGFLGTELNNITFPGEAQGAVTTARDFEAYIEGDAVIRADANRGDLAGAVAFDIGTQAGQSNYRYYQYDQALGHIVAINEDAFRSAIADGRSALGIWSWLPYAIGAALLALIGAAIYPRLREYR